MRRLAPDVMDVPAVQAWLEDWAARGWYVEAYGLYLAKFVPGEKREHVRYRLQPVGAEGGEPDWDIREAYREMGWSYVCSSTSYMSLTRIQTEFHIWRCDDPDAPEMDTDQALREEAYGDLLWRMRRDILLVLPLIAALAGLVLWSVWDNPRHYLVEQYPSSMSLMLCCNGLISLRCVNRAARLIRFTRRLRSEEPAPQRAPWRRARARAWLFVGLYLLILLVMTGNLLHLDDSRPYLPVSQWEEPVPYVSLAELGTPAAEGARAVDFHSVWGKSVWWCLEGDYENPPYCDTEYYSLRFPSMAANLEEQLRHQWSVVGLLPDGLGALAPPPGVDSVRWWRDETEGWQCLIIRRGGQVFHTVYWGEADLRDHLDSYVSMLERFG